MTWLKVSDDFLRHRKLEMFEDDHRRWERNVSVWLACALYAADRETDGLVHVGRVRRACHPDTDVASALNDLLEAGLVDLRHHEFWLHDFLDYNESHSDLEHRRRNNRDRQKRFREKRRVNRVRNAVTNGVSNAERNGGSNAPPGPARPGPIEQDQCASEPHDDSAEEKRIARHAGAQLGAAVTRWLNSHLQRSGKRAFHPSGDQSQSGGRRWRKLGWDRELVQQALELRCIDLEGLEGGRYLRPKTLFNGGLADFVSMVQEGTTPEKFRAMKASKSVAPPPPTRTRREL